MTDPVESSLENYFTKMEYAAEEYEELCTVTKDYIDNIRSCKAEIACHISKLENQVDVEDFIQAQL